MEEMDKERNSRDETSDHMQYNNKRISLKENTGLIYNLSQGLF